LPKTNKNSRAIDGAGLPSPGRELDPASLLVNEGG
jgi:hypothetical protein